MKKCRKYALFFTVLGILFLLMPIHTNAEKKISGNVAYADSKPKIDGKIDEIWGAADKLYGEQLNEMYGTQTDEELSDTTFMQSYAQLLWDKQGLYLLAVVYDTTVSVNDKMASDSVDFWVSEKNTEAMGYTSSGDWYCTVTVDGMVAMYAEGVEIHDVADASVAVYDDRYIVEVHVPYQSDMKPKNGFIMGFNVSFNNDTDGDGNSDICTYWKVSEDSKVYWVSAAALPELMFVSSEHDLTGIIIMGIILVIVTGVFLVYILKRNRRYSLLLLCMFFMPLSVRAQEPVEVTSQRVTAEYTKRSPIIDGKIDEVWENTPFYYAKYCRSTSEVGEKTEVNPIKGSYAKILWDEEHYYLLGVVYDTTLSEAGFTDWNSVDYWISEKNTQTYGWDSDEGDYCYCITDDGTQVVQQHKNGAKVYGKELVGSQKSAVNYGDYYVVEIKIPWQSDIVVENGNEIGFTVSFNDDMNGDGERDAYTYWATQRNGEYWNNTNALVTVELVGQEVIVNPFVIVGAIVGVLVVGGVVCVICIKVRKNKRH